MRRTLHVVAGEPELNCWCPVCLLPIRLRVPLHLDDAGSTPVGVLEICPGCGTGHDRPSVAVATTPREPREWHPLVAAARAVHRWACRRSGRPALLCAFGECRWPGLYRHEQTVLGDEGTWRYVFCSRRHGRAWAAHYGITFPALDRGNAG